MGSLYKFIYFNFLILVKRISRRGEVFVLLIEFIAKYWLEVLFGLICSGVTFAIRHHLKLAKQDKERHEKDLIDAIQAKMDEQSKETKQQMAECYSNLISVVREYDEKSRLADEHMQEEIDVIKDGMLSIEGRAFKNDCRRLLEETHIITLDEYEALVAEHMVYNSLGGNHEGDALFSMVEIKYKNSLSVVHEE